jgi:uncharacterized protein (TIGR00730 family)
MEPSRSTPESSREARQLCVFCGSSSGVRPQYAAQARALGEALVRRGLGLVYGGGRVGLMGVIADAVLEAGGRCTGVIPRALATKELLHDGVSDVRRVTTMHERKALMAELSAGFIALPGGLGTLEEFCEILTWAQLGIHRKPCGLLNVEGYFDPLLVLFDHAHGEGFVRPEHRALVLAAEAPDELLDAFEAFEPPLLPRWIDWEKT